MPSLPFPSRLGVLGVDARYVASGITGRDRGDVYDAVMSPFGPRLLIGDVMGRGLPAVEPAEQVFRAWRQLASTEESLPGIAMRLHSLVAFSFHAELFVTAQLITIAGNDTAELVSCGHPPPLLFRGDTAVYGATPSSSLPLGLLDLGSAWCAVDKLPFAAGDAMLLYTDGVTEARDEDGRFYPLHERALAMRRSRPAGLLAALESDLIRHVGGKIIDDATLLLIQHEAARSSCRSR